MEHVSKLEVIFSSGSFTDILNAVEASLLKGGTLLDTICCDPGTMCKEGTVDEKGNHTCAAGISCTSGSDY
jgi:hypothetical protein